LRRAPAQLGAGLLPLTGRVIIATHGLPIQIGRRGPWVAKMPEADDPVAGVIE